MRLVSFGPRGSEAPGVLVKDFVLPLARLLAEIGVERTDSVRSALPSLGVLRAAIATALFRGVDLIPVAQTRLGPPIVDPPNLFCCGGNYFWHLEEEGVNSQKMPTMPFDPIVRPIECANFDYEAELAVVIGKGGRRISADRAAQHIAGYM